MKASSRYLHYIYPIVVIAVVTAIKYYFFREISFKAPFILYFGSVLLCAYMWGVRPALVAVISGTLAAVYFFIEPYNSFVIQKESIGRAALFLCESSVILLLATNFYRARGLAKTEQKRFQLLIEKSSDGIVLFNKKGQVIYASPSVERIIGYTPEEFKKKDRKLLVFPDEVERIDAIVADLLVTPGKSVIVEHQYRHADGKWVMIETTLTNLLEEEGVNALVSNFRDITDRIALETQREDFMGIISHELKTPLTTLKGYHQLGEQNPELIEDAYKKMSLPIRRMERLIQDILDTTALIKNKIQLHVYPVNINSLIQDAVQNIQLTHIRQKIEMHLASIPDVECDEHRIAQVLSNLLNNATKYSAAGTTITVESFYRDNTVTVRVKDQGVGLNELQKQSVFKRFYRGGSNISGLGLGLYIAAQIIKMHNGFINAESEEGKGSVFQFTIPIKQQ